MGLTIDYTGLNHIQHPPGQIPDPNKLLRKKIMFIKAPFNTYNLTLMMVKQTNSKFCTVQCTYWPKAMYGTTPYKKYTNKQSAQPEEYAL